MHNWETAENNQLWKGSQLSSPDVGGSPAEKAGRPAEDGRYLVQPEQEFEYNNPLWNNENEKRKEKEKCPEEEGLYIPAGKGENSDEMKVLRQIAGKFANELEVDKNGRILIEFHYPHDLVKDAGFKLLHDIIFNGKGKKILFTVANALKGIDKMGNEVTYPVFDTYLSGRRRVSPTLSIAIRPKEDMNFSEQDRLDKPEDATKEEIELWNKANARPEKCFNGSVAIPKNVRGLKDTSDSDPDEIHNAPNKSQASLAFHALAENFFRTVGQKPFPIAHKMAKDLILPYGHPAFSRFPGGAALDYIILKIFP